MSRTEQIKYAEQMDIANKALNVINNKKILRTSASAS